MLAKLAQVNCQEPVQKHLLRCEHTAVMPCWQDPSTFICKERCGGTMECCSKACKSLCSECQSASVGPTVLTLRTQVVRAVHLSHPCDRSLYCQHSCGLDCSQDHHCNTRCKQACRQQCLHHKCSKPCSEPCAPCMEPCPWSCAHHSCPVLCGSVSRVSFSHNRNITKILFTQICARLPCDEACTNTLACGHACPSG